MGRKKNLKGSVDELEMEFIEEKMKKDSALNYLTSQGLKEQLKMLGYKINVKCKNAKQKEFFEQMKDDKNEVCFGIGSPGTGKSFLSFTYALKALKEGKFSKIVIVTPTAQAGGADLAVGYLKGTLEEKLQPFLDSDKATISKILKLSGNEDYGSIASSLIRSNLIQYEFVNFLLGKTIDNAIILVSESEQYTKENLRLILTRLGENSKIIITGDIRQVNRRSIKNNRDICGLSYAVEKLGDMDEVSVVEFTEEDIVRNGLITKILQRFDD